jgi:MFS family permease
MTQLQQLLSTLLVLSFGILALAVWHRTVGVDRRAAGWGVAGACFAVAGAVAMVHAMIAAVALDRGAGSPAYRLAVEWGMAANIGRAVAALLLPALLLGAITTEWRWLRRPFGILLPLALTATVLATVAARRLHDGSIFQPVAALAVLMTVLAVSLMGVLLFALASDAIDRLLWFALVLYALKEALSVSLLAILAWWSAATDPLAFRLFYWLMIATMAAMSGMALRRLVHARSGRRVPAPFQRFARVHRASIG